MVTVYIIVLDIIIKFIRGILYLRRRPLSFKLIYSHIIKYLLYNLIIFNKGDYFHLFPAPIADKRIDLIYLLYELCPGPVQPSRTFVFYGMVMPGESKTETSRCVFIIDDKQVIRAMIYYPLTTGRNTDEISQKLNRPMFKVRSSVRELHQNKTPLKGVLFF